MTALLSIYPQMNHSLMKIRDSPDAPQSSRSTEAVRQSVGPLKFCK